MDLNPSVIDYNFWAAMGGILLVTTYAYFSNRANLSGVAAGALIAVVLYVSTQWQGLFYFFAFFLLGSLASKWKINEKERLGLAQQNKGRRSAIHAFSNAGPAAFFAFFGFAHAHQEAAYAAVAAVFAACLSDTLSSETGTVIGKRHWNIITFKQEKKGADGAVSLEGSTTGILGSLIIGLLYYLFNRHISLAILVVTAGIAGNLTDSILGATFQKKERLNNHQVNLVASFLAGLLAFMFSSFFW